MNIWPIKGKDTEYLQLEITSYCNLECPGCERSFHKEFLSDILNKKYMSLENIKKWFTINTLPNLKLISFSGQIDEPIIHPQILDIVKYFLNEFNVNLNLSTNGSTRNEKLFRELGILCDRHRNDKGNKKLDIEFAIDGLADTNHIYRVGSNFNKIIKHVKAYINNGGKASWKFIMFKHNQHQLHEAKKLSDELGFSRFTYIHSKRKHSEHMNIIKIDNNKKNENVDNKKINCKALNHNGRKGWLFVNHDGAAQPCCYFGYKLRSKDPLDNLNNISIDDYFETSPFLNDIQQSWYTDNPHPTCSKKCSGSGYRDDVTILRINDKDTFYEVKNR